MLSSYPDYGKATEGYINGVVEAFAQFDEGIQLQLAHITVGIRSRHSYLPTVENVVVMARELLAERHRKEDFDKRFSRKFETHRIEGPRNVFRPFPKLWEALGQKADEWLRGMVFDDVADLAKTLHLKGAEAMRLQFASLKQEQKRKAA